MAPTPLTAPYRLSMFYTVDLLQHVQRFYLDCVPSADASGFDTVARSGYSNVGLSTVPDRWFAWAQPFYDAPVASFDYWLLEAYNAGNWVYQFSTAFLAAPTGTGTYAKSGMECWSGKDTNNKPMNVYFYEKFFASFSKSSSYAGLSADNQAIANALFNAGGTAVDADPVAWRRSRGNVYSQRWIALVTDSNQKLRRIRNLT